MPSWPPSLDELRLVPLPDLRERAQARCEELEAELAAVRDFVRSADQLIAQAEGRAADPRTEPSGTPAPTSGPPAGGGTIPERVLAALRGAGRAMTARELTEALFGPDFSRATLEGVRKAALRLTARGVVRRVDSKTFAAAEVGD